MLFRKANIFVITIMIISCNNSNKQVKTKIISAEPKQKNYSSLDSQAKVKVKIQSKHYSEILDSETLQAPVESGVQSLKNKRSESTLLQWPDQVQNRAFSLSINEKTPKIPIELFNAYKTPANFIVSNSCGEIVKTSFNGNFFFLEAQTNDELFEDCSVEVYAELKSSISEKRIFSFTSSLKGFIKDCEEYFIMKEDTALCDGKTLSQIQKQTHLSLSEGMDLHLNLLKYYKNLSSLSVDSLGRNTDFSIIKDMKLKEFAISNTIIKDTSFITQMSSLTQLSIQKAAIKDISFLSGLTQLQKLSLMQNQIEDISPIEQLEKLEVLDISENVIKDFSILSGNNTLRELDLSSNPIEDFSTLSTLENLQSLKLRNMGLKLLPKEITETQRLTHVDISQNENCAIDNQNEALNLVCNEE